ncbi:MAG: serine/threonine protein kinase [Candidatus Obscuribacterales bacterium]|nr:serine/threonine protein kinase [Candidatus Obscuribacterales bacterium]
MHTLSAGTVIDDRYEVTGILGTGGMGTVYEATELHLNRKVAVKIIHQAIARTEDNLARFRREADVLSHLQHKNLVGFYRYGVWKGMPYVVLERLSGQPLSKILADGPIAPRQALSIAEQVLEALCFVHGKGIVHRDLKPSNLILLDTHQIKILDFGLCGILNSADAQALTESGLLIGSVHYMSPEICTGKKADTKADIYALGIILYQMLTGTPPFDHESPIGLLYKHANDPIPSLHNQYPLLPMASQIDALLESCLAKQPDDRPDASRLLEAIRALSTAMPESGPLTQNLVLSSDNSKPKKLPKLIFILLPCALILATLCASPSGCAFVALSAANFLSDSQKFDYELKLVKLAQKAPAGSAYARALLISLARETDDSLLQAFVRANLGRTYIKENLTLAIDTTKEAIHTLNKKGFEKLQIDTPQRRALFEDTVETICGTLANTASRWTQALQDDMKLLDSNFGDNFPVCFAKANTLRLVKTSDRNSYERSDILASIGERYFEADSLAALRSFKQSLFELDIATKKTPLTAGEFYGALNQRAHILFRCAQTCSRLYATTKERQWATDGLAYGAEGTKTISLIREYDAHEYCRALLQNLAFILEEATLQCDLGNQDKATSKLELFNKLIPSAEQMVKKTLTISPRDLEALKERFKQLHQHCQLRTGAP